ncbi:MAG: ABC transporter substrate-binding protein [Cyanobacteria bacterium J06638_22]
MSQKNETPALLVALIVTLLLIGGGIWFLLRNLNLGGVLPQPSSPTATIPGGSDPPTNPNTPTTSNSAIAQRLSIGDRILFPDGATPAKGLAVQAIAEGNYEMAIAELETSLQDNRNDPEALIYLSNARIGEAAAYTIAVSVPAEAATNQALELLRGVAQAQMAVNEAGGINGVPLRVAIAIDNDEQSTVTQVAEALTQDSRVLGVIGHFSSGSSLAAAPIYEEAGLPMISPTSTSVQLSGQGQYVFRTVPSDRFTATTLSRYLINNLQQGNAAIFFNGESDYSLSLKNEFSTALLTDGGQILSEFDVSAGGFDATAAVQQAQQQGASVLVLLTNTATLEQALDVIAVNGQQLPLLGGDSLFNPTILETGGQNALGMTVAVPWVIQSNAESEFAIASRQLWGGAVNWRTAMAYDATTALSAGLSVDPTRDGLTQALKDPSFSVEGATGTIRFLPSGDRNQPMQLVQVTPSDRTGFGYAFEPVE